MQRPSLGAQLKSLVIQYPKSPVSLASIYNFLLTYDFSDRIPPSAAIEAHEIFSKKLVGGKDEQIEQLILDKLKRFQTPLPAPIRLASFPRPEPGIEPSLSPQQACNELFKRITASSLSGVVDFIKKNSKALKINDLMVVAERVMPRTLEPHNSKHVSDILEVISQIQKGVHSFDAPASGSAPRVGGMGASMPSGEVKVELQPFGYSSTLSGRVNGMGKSLAAQQFVDELKDGGESKSTGKEPPLDAMISNEILRNNCGEARKLLERHGAELKQNQKKDLFRLVEENLEKLSDENFVWIYQRLTALLGYTSQTSSDFGPRAAAQSPAPAQSAVQADISSEAKEKEANRIFYLSVKSLVSKGYYTQAMGKLDDTRLNPEDEQDLLNLISEHIKNPEFSKYQTLYDLDDVIRAAIRDEAEEKILKEVVEILKKDKFEEVRKKLNSEELSSEKLEDLHERVLQKQSDFQGDTSFENLVNDLNSLIDATKIKEQEIKAKKQAEREERARLAKEQAEKEEKERLAKEQEQKEEIERQAKALEEKRLADEAEQKRIAEEKEKLFKELESALKNNDFKTVAAKLIDGAEKLTPAHREALRSLASAKQFEFMSDENLSKIILRTGKAFDAKVTLKRNEEKAVAAGMDSTASTRSSAVVLTPPKSSQELYVAIDGQLENHQLEAAYRELKAQETRLSHYDQNALLNTALDMSDPKHRKHVADPNGWLAKIVNLLQTNASQQAKVSEKTSPKSEAAKPSKPVSTFEQVQIYLAQQEFKQAYALLKQQIQTRKLDTPKVVELMKMLSQMINSGASNPDLILMRHYIKCQFDDPTSRELEERIIALKWIRAHEFKKVLDLLKESTLHFAILDELLTEVIRLDSKLLAADPVLTELGETLIKQGGIYLYEQFESKEQKETVYIVQSEIVQSEQKQRELPPHMRWNAPLPGVLSSQTPAHQSMPDSEKGKAAASANTAGKEAKSAAEPKSVVAEILDKDSLQKLITDANKKLEKFDYSLVVRVRQILEQKENQALLPQLNSTELEKLAIHAVKLGTPKTHLARIGELIGEFQKTKAAGSKGSQMAASGKQGAVKSSAERKSYSDIEVAPLMPRESALIKKDEILELFQHQNFTGALKELKKHQALLHQLSKDELDELMFPVAIASSIESTPELKELVKLLQHGEAPVPMTDPGKSTHAAVAATLGDGIQRPDFNSPRGASAPIPTPAPVKKLTFHPSDLVLSSVDPLHPDPLHPEPLPLTRADAPVGNAEFKGGHQRFYRPAPLQTPRDEDEEDLARAIAMSLAKN